MGQVAVYDACVLHPAPLRDLLIRLARAGLVRARWSDAILDECFRSILRRRPEIAEPFMRTRQLMNAAVRDCLISGYEGLIDTLDLPDPNDRHVLAAAIWSGAEVIVTANLADFPTTVLATHRIEAMHPDFFVESLVDAAPTAVLSVVARQAADLRNPPHSIDDVLDGLQAVGLQRSVARLRLLVCR